MIIGITGACEDINGNRRMAGAGKNAVADYLVMQLGFTSIAWADPMKRFCKEVFDFTDKQLWGDNGDKTKPDTRYPRPQHTVMEQTADVTENDVEYLTPRFALQTLGTGWGRQCYEDVWVNYGLRQATRLLSDVRLSYTPQQGVHVNPDPLGPTIKGVIFNDLRYFNEFEGVKCFGGKVIRVKRKIDTAFDMKSMNHLHSSETELLSWDDDKFDYIIDNNSTLTVLGLMVDRALDIFKGKMRLFDEEQKDVPPFLRR